MLKHSITLVVLGTIFTTGLASLTGLAKPTLVEVYRPGTCRQGYVWRQVVRNDFVCVTPETRVQAAYDNSQASARRVGVQAITPERLHRRPITRQSETLLPEVRYRKTVIPSNPKFPQFVGISRKSYQEARSDAVSMARQSLGSRYGGNDDLNYKEVKREEGLSEGTWVSWVLIELVESNSDYYPLNNCPDPDPNDNIGVSCEDLSSACYFRDPRLCSRK